MSDKFIILANWVLFGFLVFVIGLMIISIHVTAEDSVDSHHRIISVEDGPNMQRATREALRP
jgi:hypothetical protein